MITGIRDCSWFIHALVKIHGNHSYRARPAHAIRPRCSCCYKDGGQLAQRYSSCDGFGRKLLLPGRGY
ncbi:unnamed protein product [Lathyrus sativus]|nr:unnamed protein product [Lathyrus sativus]